MESAMQALVRKLGGLRLVKLVVSVGTGEL